MIEMIIMDRMSNEQSMIDTSGVRNSLHVRRNGLKVETKVWTMEITVIWSPDICRNRLIPIDTAYISTNY